MQFPVGRAWIFFRFVGSNLACHANFVTRVQVLAQLDLTKVRVVSPSEGAGRGLSHRKHCLVRFRQAPQ